MGRVPRGRGLCLGAVDSPLHAETMTQGSFSPTLKVTQASWGLTPLSPGLHVARERAGTTRSLFRDVGCWGTAG